MLDSRYGMKFNLSDNQLVGQDDPTAHFSRWAKMGVVGNPVRNAAFKLFKSVNTQSTLLQWCQSKLLTLNLLTRCESKQLRTNFIDNFRVILPSILQKKKMADAAVSSGWISERCVAVQIQV